MVFYSWIARKNYILGKTINLYAYDDRERELAQRIARVLAEQLFEDGIVLELTGDGFDIQDGKGYFSLEGILTGGNHVVYTNDTSRKRKSAPETTLARNSRAF